MTFSFGAKIYVIRPIYTIYVYMLARDLLREKKVAMGSTSEIVIPC